MNTAENRRIVQDNLDQKKVIRFQWEKEREQQQEAYEQDMITACNLHCADARKEREKAEADARRRAQRAQAKVKKWELECKSVNAWRQYGIAALVMLLISAVTKLPFIVAAAMIITGAIFPAIYIFRLYNPIQR